MWTVKIGGMNPNFFVVSGNEPNGQALPHEIRYVGSCTSDIWHPEN